MSSLMRGNFRMALASVRGAKGRSMLTMLGVIVGIVSVVTVVGLGEGMKHQVAGAINKFGDDLITVRPGGNILREGRSIADTDIVLGQNRAGGLTADDVTTVLQVPSVDIATPLGVVSGVVQAEDQQLHGGSVIAASSDFPKVVNQEVPFGSMWSDGEEASNFVVLGRDAAQELFGEPAPLGQKLMFHGEQFIVRAVLAEFGDVPLSPTAGFDNNIFIPYQTAARLTENRSQAYAVLAKPHTPKQFDEAIVAITEELKGMRGGQQDFDVLTPEQQIAASSNVFNLLSTWAMTVAAIALLIGGVGLMNIMLVSVSERRHEIGLRKAVGATQRQIMWQFLLEAVVLSGVGGLLGVLFSLGAHGALLAYTDLKPILSWEAIAIAVGVSVVIGIIFGTIPAAKAASKDPIDALRHE